VCADFEIGDIIYFLPGWKAGSFDLFWLEKIDHMKQNIFVCIHATYSSGLKTGQKWSEVPVFAPARTTRMPVL
jgi:hypothetical protein